MTDLIDFVMAPTIVLSAATEGRREKFDDRFRLNGLCRSSLG
jgi:hypothetical protein